MHLGADCTAYDTIHLEGSLLAIGSIELHRDLPAFEATKALLHHYVVLPRRPLAIEQDGVTPFVAEPTMLTLHNPLVPYRRRALGSGGDASDYLALQPQLLDEIGHALLLPRRRFARAQVALDAAHFARAQALFAAARRGAAPLALEECALGFVARALAGPLPAPRRATPGRLDAVGRAKRYLATHLAGSPTLADVARAAHASPFHLTRLFRAATGMPLHAWAMALRARRAALELPHYRGRLQALAHELGYVDAAHLSRCFRAAFGVPPSRFAPA